MTTAPRVALVTGGADGIGAGIVRRLVEDVRAEDPVAEEAEVLVAAQVHPEQRQPHHHHPQRDVEESRDGEPPPQSPRHDERIAARRRVAEQQHLDDGRNQ